MALPINHLPCRWTDEWKAGLWISVEPGYRVFLSERMANHSRRFACLRRSLRRRRSGCGAQLPAI